MFYFETKAIIIIMHARGKEVGIPTINKDFVFLVCTEYIVCLS